MLKKTLMLAMCMACIVTCYAQLENPEKVKERKVNHYIGVQANELIKQIVNLNNSANSVIDNPYLLTYSINSAKKGWGAHAGVGYDFKKIEDKDAPGDRETKMSEVSFRIGAEKKFSIGKRFQGGVGFDLVNLQNVNKTFSVSVTNFGSGIDSTFTSSESKVMGLGFGPQFSFCFKITDKVMLGTEATSYFIKSEDKQHVIVTETIIDFFNNTSTTTTSNTNVESKTSEISFRIPVALFLIIKL